MSTFFNTNQPQTSTGNTGLFGNTPNQLNFQGVGVNNQQVTQNLVLNNVQQPTVLDSRSTVRQLTTLIPEWKGHFDLADHLMTSQEQTLTNVSMLLTQLQNIYENLLSTFDFSKTSLNDINLQQDKLNNDLSERLKYQDLQNLVTIKSRRLCEVIISNNPSTDVSSSFRIPNHINVQVSKELYERVRNLKNEIDFIQNEVQLLKEIDVFQAPTFIESVLNSHDSRITNLGDSLTKLLNRAESILNKDLKREVWSGLVVDSSTLRKNFLDAIGLKQTKPESESVPLTEVKKQIKYLKKFNSSYNDPNFQYMRDYGYNIKDLLVNTVPNQSLMMPSPNYQTNGLNPGTGGPNLFGQLNQTQPFGSSLYGTAGTPGVTGLGVSGPFGSSATTTGATGLGTTGSGLFGTSTTPTTGFGTTQPNTGLTTFGSSGNLLHSSTGGCPNLYAQQFQKQQPVGSNQFGVTTGLVNTGGLATATGFSSTQGTGFGVGTTGTPSTGFGSTQPSTGLFGTTSTTSTPGLGTTGLGGTTGTAFGTTSTGTGLFGSTTTTATTGLGTSGFGTTTTTQPSTGLFGSTTTTQPSTGFGTTQSLGTSSFGGTTTSGGFGFGQTGLGGTQTQSSNLFGHSSTGTGSSANLLALGGTQQSTGLFGSNTGTGTGFGSTSSTGFGTTQSTGSSLFGSTTTTGTTTGLGGTTGTAFGTTTTSGPFGSTTSTGFGSNTGTGFSNTTATGTGLFGNTSSNAGFATTSTGTGLFGSSNTSGSGFGSGTTGSGLFGSSTTPSTGFGSSTSTGLGGSSSNLFGSTSTTSLFGNTTQTKPPGTELALYTNPTSTLTLNR